MTIWAAEVFPNVNQRAAPGIPGQIADWIGARLAWRRDGIPAGGQQGHQRRCFGV